MRIVVFLFALIVYVFAAFPALAPYRDSGEMVSVIKTLGVAHPPGYPLYTLLGNIICGLIPFSNYAYKVTIVSAIFMAFSVLLIYEISKKIFSGAGHFSFGALAAGFSYLFWYLAIVQEMYTMSVFFILLSIYFLLSKKYYVSMFMLGLSTGVRMDSVLIYPAFLLFFIRKKLRVFDIAKSHIFLILGSSVFLYLLIRSNTAPLINWNDPSTFERLLSSLMRKTHGGTLDLISAGYAKGENFVPQLKFYFVHLYEYFFYMGPLISVFGAVKLFREKKDIFLFLAAGFIISGVFFIYLANMPPNPHALAILEAHFLLPNIFFTIFLISGISAISDYSGIAGKSTAVILCAGIFISTFPVLNKRMNFFLTDYARNLSAGLPKNSIIVLKEDVQVFSMWHQRYVTLKRPDIKTVPSGLSGSPWFQKSNRDIGVKFFPLSTATGWQSFIEKNSDVYFTNDVDFPLKTKTFPYGLSNSLTKKPHESFNILNEFYVYRGDYRYHSHVEFFTPDLIEEYSKSWHQAGFYYMLKNEFSAAEKCFLMSLYMKNDFPQPAYHLGWCHYIQNNFMEAAKFYNLATIMYDKLIGLAAEYKAMPDVAISIKREAANVWLHMGVASEKLGKDKEALSSYVKATELRPDFALAYYNKAVIYWKNGDFRKSRENLELTLRYDPSNETARGYLERLKTR